MQPSSFCSLATYGCHREMFGLLLSISLYHKNTTVYCLVDTKTKEYIINSTPKIDLNIVWIVLLDEYTGLDRSAMEAQGVWADFQMQKAMIISEALQNEDDTLFLDSDILLLDTIEDVDKSKQLGVSPHYISKSRTDIFGYYNGGMLWTNQKSLKNDWIEFTKTSRYFDQASIEDLVEKYDAFQFGENYNFSWWRITQSDDSPQNVINNLSILDDKQLCYKKKSLKFIHTHFNETRQDVKLFNDVILKCLNYIKDYKSLLIINRMVTGKWAVQIPQQPIEGKWYHSNDSFRELLVLVEEKNKDLELEIINNSGHVWLNGNILLYDRPTTEWIDEQSLQCYKLLLGNGSIDKEGVELKDKNIDVSPWIFWPRRPSILEQKLGEGIVNYEDRNIESIFIGNYENYIQQDFRNNPEWENEIEEFYCTAGTNHRFSQEEYLDKIRHSKYGLCLRGFGSKCHREVELMAFGTVPLMTPEVSMNSYSDPLIENTHYILINDPLEVKEKIKDINRREWNRMSAACYIWYRRNVHSDNCWNNILDNIFYK